MCLILGGAVLREMERDLLTVTRPRCMQSNTDPSHRTGKRCKEKIACAEALFLHPARISWRENSETTRPVLVATPPPAPNGKQLVRWLAPSHEHPLREPCAAWKARPTAAPGLGVALPHHHDIPVWRGGPARRSAWCRALPTLLLDAKQGLRGLRTRGRAIHPGWAGHRAGRLCRIVDCSEPPSAGWAAWSGQAPGSAFLNLAAPSY